LIRDFLILHYHRTDREDSEFWRYCKNMSVPESLSEKMMLFEGNAVLYRDPDVLFRESSWVQVMVGQGLMPKSFHAMTNRLSSAQLTSFLSDVQKLIERAVTDLPDHQAFIDAHCKSDLQ